MFSRLLFGKTKERVECYLQGSIIFTAAAFCCDSAVCGKTAAKSERQLWFLSLPYIFPSLPTIYFPYNLSSEHGLNCLLLATYLQPAKMAPGYHGTMVLWYHINMVSAKMVSLGNLVERSENTICQWPLPSITV